MPLCRNHHFENGRCTSCKVSHRTYSESKKVFDKMLEGTAPKDMESWQKTQIKDAVVCRSHTH